MKEILKRTLLVLGVVICFRNTNVLASDINIYLDGQPQELSHEAFIEDGRIFVPLRNLCDKMGVLVNWKEDTHKIELQRGFTKCIFTVDSNKIVVNNESKTIDVAPRIINDRTYVPLRAFQEALGDKITWYDNPQAVYIASSDKTYLNGSWNKIVDLKKTYESKDDDGEVCAFVKICVPQILNPNNMVAIDKINEYYKETGSEFFEKFKQMCIQDKEDVMRNWQLNKVPYGYELSYVVGYNANDILSVQNVLYMNTGGAHPNWSVCCDLFDTKTGEKLEIDDILKGTKEEIEQFIIDGYLKLIDENPDNYYETAKEDLEEYIKAVDFYIEDGNLVFIFNRYIIAPYAAGIKELKVNIGENKDMFKRKFNDVFDNYNEQDNIKNIASSYYNGDVELVDKTILQGDKCYVLKSIANQDIFAIDVNSNNIYYVEKQDDMYIVSNVKKIDRNVNNEEALKLVMDKINSDEYSYEIGGYLLEDGNEYIIVVIQDMEEKTSSKLVVNKKTGDISTYYFE